MNDGPLKRFAADHRLPHNHQGDHPRRQVQIGPAAEADKTILVARAHGLSFMHEAKNTTGDQAGDLHDRHVTPVRQADGHSVPLVLLARLVQAGAEEGAVAIGDPCHGAIDRHAVGVDVQDREENADPPARFIAQAELLRRNGLPDHHDAPIRRRHDGTGPSGWGAGGVSEKEQAEQREGQPEP